MDKIRGVNKRFYNSHSNYWAERHINSFWHENQFRKFITYFKKNDTVIDIGCAWGIHVPLFLGIGRKLRYEGIDISNKMIGIAKKRFPQVSFRVANILERKSFPNKRYEGFFAGAVLMHVPEKQWPQLLGNMEKIIKPRGIGYMTLPQKRPSAESQKDQRYFTFWSKAKLERFISKRGWKVIASGKMPDSLGKWSWFMVKLP